MIVGVPKVDSLGMLPINLSKYKKLYSQIIKNVFTNNPYIFFNTSWAPRDS